MANKNTDPIYALAEQIVGSSEKLAESKVNKAQYDKSFTVVVLGVNQKFTGDVSAEDKTVLIEKYSIPSEIEEGSPNYYTIKINGAYYISKQNGNFKLYDKVMAYLPNSDWSRLYLDYPSYYYESEEGGNGTGKWLDDAHTSVAHNDWDNNSSQGLYDSIDGYDNVLTGVGSVIEDRTWTHCNTCGRDEPYVYSSGRCSYCNSTDITQITKPWLRENTANTVCGSYNQGSACQSDLIAGHGNILNNSSDSIIAGGNNKVQNANDSIISGYGLNIGGNGAYCSIISGHGTKVLSYANESFISGGTYSSVYKSISVGNIRGSSGPAQIYYSIVVADSATVDDIDSCIVSGRANTVVGGKNCCVVGQLNVVQNYNNIVGGQENRVLNNDNVVCGSENVAQTTGSVVCGTNNTVLDGYSIVAGQSNTMLNGGNHNIICGEHNTVNGYNIAALGAYHNIEQSYCTAVGWGAEATSTSPAQYRFVVGGSRGSDVPHNVMTVDYNGNVAAASYGTGNGDYSETYEWFDGNPDNEDRRGLFVTLDGIYIKPVTSEDDYILGVISATPSVCGDTHDLCWKGKYKKDIFGEIQTDEDGNAIISDDFNPDLQYIPQSVRKEKAKVGTHGKLVVVDDGTCQPNQYCKPSANGIGTHTDDKNYYRVLERLDDTHIRIVVK